MGFFRHSFEKGNTVRIDDARCVRCGICVKECRHNVLAMVTGDKGLHVGIMHPENCVSCGHCVEACIFNALSIADRTAKGSGSEMPSTR